MEPRAGPILSQNQQDLTFVAEKPRPGDLLGNRVGTGRIASKRGGHHFGGPVTGQTADQVPTDWKHGASIVLRASNLTNSSHQARPIGGWNRLCCPVPRFPAAAQRTESCHDPRIRNSLDRRALAAIYTFGRGTHNPLVLFGRACQFSRHNGVSAVPASWRRMKFSTMYELNARSSIIRQLSTCPETS